MVDMQNKSVPYHKSSSGSVSSLQSASIVCSLWQKEEPSHLQNIVHARFAATQPQLLILHGVSEAHEQQTIFII